MGGGGGGGSRSLGNTKDLERRAKELLERGSAGKRNVFISFAFEDLNEVNLLRGQAKNENSDVEFNDRSLHEPYESTRSEYIRLKLRERINQCTATIVYITEHSAASRWVEWEVAESLRLGKRVIAVHSGTAPRAIPDVISRNRLRVVPWSQLAAELNRP
jgi:hypothetical protein